MEMWTNWNSHILLVALTTWKLSENIYLKWGIDLSFDSKVYAKQAYVHFTKNMSVFVAKLFKIRPKLVSLYPSKQKGYSHAVFFLYN